VSALGGLSLSRPAAEDVTTDTETLVLTDGVRTHVFRHAAARPDRMPVLYVHGIQSHPGWFVGSAQVLARAGHMVYQVTRRGSGLAGIRRGDAPSAGQLLEDVAAAVEHVRDATGAERLALAGVSWGGKLLAAYGLARPDGVASLTLVAPGIVPRVSVPPRTKLAIAAARVFWPRKTFDIPLNDVALFTDNPAMREYLRRDARRLHRATARFLVASVMLDRRLAAASDGALAVPTTLILAERDRIIDNAATVAVVDRLTGGRARTIRLDAAHTMEFEPDPTVFFEALRGAVIGQEVSP